MQMNIRAHFCILVLALFFGEPLFAQNERYSEFYLIRKKYENRLENDSTSLPLIRELIQKAKNEKQYKQLFQGYSDGIRWSAISSDKLKYADSVILAANLTRDRDLIGKSYLAKGVVYYFNFKKYKLALDEYLKAYDYAKDSNDEYYKNRLAYLIGVVKSYIGYYDEALTQFSNTRAFFDAESKKEIHPNLLYGNMRGYYNSLHQMVICYRNLGRYKSVDSIIDIGLSGTAAIDDYQQEYGYFLKEKGIRQFCKKEYRSAIRSLKGSLVPIASVNDFAWMTVCYSYIGKSYMELGDTDDAMQYFKKVDSIFQNHDFTLPELRNNYERLINFYKKEKDTKKELYYTKQLLKADNIITRDFANLSSKIYREYDTSALREGKSRLEQKMTGVMWLIRVLVIITMTLFIFFLIKYKAAKNNREQYRLLEQKILSKDERPIRKAFLGSVENNSIEIEPKVVDDILIKLDDFEKNLGFIEGGLTLNKLAAKFDTNQTYLALVVKLHKGVNFSRYLNVLRIAYITEKLYNDKKYLRYTIETLGEECGIASRNNFSILFESINGIKPTDFIKKRLADISNESGAID
jgi:AraC-like DNA-binding protein